MFTLEIIPNNNYKCSNVFYSTGLPSPPVIENKKNKVAFSELNLVWSSPDSNGCSLTMYTIYYRKIQSPGTPWHCINATAATNSMSAFPLECDTQYEFAVTAWNKLGESELSQSWQVRSTTGTPTLLKHDCKLLMESF